MSDDRLVLENERLKAVQVAAYGEPAARWWAARFLEALDSIKRIEANQDWIYREAHRDADSFRVAMQCVKARAELLEGLIGHALNELGVPGEGYPAPVVEAISILRLGKP